jgi:hypothetical protein
MNASGVGQGRHWFSAVPSCTAASSFTDLVCLLACVCMYPPNKTNNNPVPSHTGQPPRFSLLPHSLLLSAPSCVCLRVSAIKKTCPHTQYTCNLCCLHTCRCCFLTHCLPLLACLCASLWNTKKLGSTQVNRQGSVWSARTSTSPEHTDSVCLFLCLCMCLPKQPTPLSSHTQVNRQGSVWSARTSTSPEQLFLRQSARSRLTFTVDYRRTSLTSGAYVMGSITLTNPNAQVRLSQFCWGQDGVVVWGYLGRGLTLVCC